MGRAGLSRQGREEAAADCGVPNVHPVLCGLPLLPLKCFQCQDQTSQDAGVLLHSFWTADLSKPRHEAWAFLSSNYLLYESKKNTGEDESPPRLAKVWAVSMSYGDFKIGRKIGNHELRAAAQNSVVCLGNTNDRF